jgi:hypothetical protein
MLVLPVLHLVPVVRLPVPLLLPVVQKVLPVLVLPEDLRRLYVLDELLDFHSSSCPCNLCTCQMQFS